MKETLSVLDFVDKNVPEPIKPLPLEVTPFKHVEEVKDLKQLANKLKSVDEFAVDLEHNQYRSFQGLMCLMQISTRTEDFIIDTLKLRIHIGPYLREAFKDPSKRKVLHGADRDIVRLQRDFGIYICNMFDTGQVLSFSLCLKGIENGKIQPGTPAKSFLCSQSQQRVYTRSYDLCTQLYEKELLTDSSFLNIYGLVGANFRISDKRLQFLQG